MKILHCITGLDVGGAETMLYRLASRMDPARFQSRVVSLLEPGPMGDRLKEASIPVDTLGMTRGVPSPAGLFKLIRIIRKWKPDVVQTWLYHADLAGLVAARLAFPFGGPKVAWNIRCSYMALEEYSKLTGVILKTCAALSGLPDAVLTNSQEAKRFHTSLGYRPKRFDVIPNGFDVDRFRPDDEARNGMRRELYIPADAPVTGHAARFDAMKDHRTLAVALGRVSERFPDAYHILVGRGVDGDNQELQRWLAEAGVPLDHVRLLGERRDMEKVMAAMDVHISSSMGESFPNVVGESMACGVPNAVTDVGDSAIIVGDTGRVVPPKDGKALGNAVIRLLEMPTRARRELSLAARDVIELEYSLPSVISRYGRMYEDMTNEAL